MQNAFEIKFDFDEDHNPNEFLKHIHKSSFSKKSDDELPVAIASSDRKKSTDAKQSKMKYLYIQMECCE